MFGAVGLAASFSAGRSLDKATASGIGQIGPSFRAIAAGSVSMVGVGGAELSYAEGGSGACLFTFHGGLGLDHTYLRPWLDPLCDQARVVFHDLRGHGQSTGRETLAVADHATFIEDADTLRDHLHVERMVVFGHSYGGFLALEYALRYPEHVSALVLCSTSASMAHIGAALEIAQQRATASELAALQAALANPVSDDAAFAQGWRALVPLYFHDRELAHEPFARTTFSAAGYNRGAFACLQTYDVTARLHEISAPALVISGRHDWLMPPHLAGAVLAAQLPNARHVVFERSGHFPFIEENDAFTATVAAWLREAC